MSIALRRSQLAIYAHPSRVISRTFDPGHEGLIPGASRQLAVMERVVHMSEAQVARTLSATLAAYANRHDDLRATFRRNFESVTGGHVAAHTELSQDRIDLIGAYFTQEYSIEGAALFNPSIVRAPDQSGCNADEMRFILSLRAVGEGHLSSIEFRVGQLGPDDEISLEPGSPHLATGEAAHHTDGDYTVTFEPTSTISERVLFPRTAADSHGLEDLRLVEFTEDDGTRTYLGTYTAYNGAQVSPHQLQTEDFVHFQLSPMRGDAALNKGMALFPRRINGVRWSLSRWDRENISVARLHPEHGWIDPVVVQAPTEDWQLVQLGTCSSPIETAEGWLVLTHGVGPMRTYAIGALLLDRDDPTRVIGTLEEPLLMPAETEREGYVPNVVYTCGALVHGRSLVLPYGCSDASVRFAFLDLPDLLHALLSPRPTNGTDPS